jgi:hypothetical protein
MHPKMLGKPSPINRGGLSFFQNEKDFFKMKGFGVPARVLARKRNRLGMFVSPCF